jgi:hypothetical protein
VTGISVFPPRRIDSMDAGLRFSGLHLFFGRGSTTGNYRLKTMRIRNFKHLETSSVKGGNPNGYL